VSPLHPGLVVIVGGATGSSGTACGVARLDVGDLPDGRPDDPGRAAGRATVMVIGGLLALWRSSSRSTPASRRSPRLPGPGRRGAQWTLFSNVVNLPWRSSSGGRAPPPGQWCSARPRFYVMSPGGGAPGAGQASGSRRNQGGRRAPGRRLGLPAHAGSAGCGPRPSRAVAAAVRFWIVVLIAVLRHPRRTPAVRLDVPGLISPAVAVARDVLSGAAVGGAAAASRLVAPHPADRAPRLGAPPLRPVGATVSAGSAPSAARQRLRWACGCGGPQVARAALQQWLGYGSPSWRGGPSIPSEASAGIQHGELGSGLGAGHRARTDPVARGHDRGGGARGGADQRARATCSVRPDGWHDATDFSFVVIGDRARRLVPGVAADRTWTSAGAPTSGSSSWRPT
jgi:hypothetical protein